MHQPTAEPSSTITSTTTPAPTGGGVVRAAAALARRAAALALAALAALAALPLAAAQGGIEITQGGGAPLDTSTLEPRYRETFEAGTPPEALLGGVLTLGADGAWSGSLEDGFYQLVNRDDPGAARYHYLTTVPGLDGPPSAGAVSVLVDRLPEGFQALGLLLHFDPATGSYYAFTVAGENGYALYRRDGDGLREVASGTSDAVRSDRANLLVAVSEGSATRYYINGAFAIAVRDEGAPHGGVGIFGTGTGLFAFDDFAVYAPLPAAGAPAAPAPAAPSERAGGDGYLGTFSDGALTLTLRVAPDGRELTGRIEAGGAVYPVAARSAFESVEGTFEADGQRHAFTASLAGDRLLLATGGATYTLARVTP